MSFSDKLLDAADVVSSVTAGVELIDKIIGNVLPHQATDAIKVISAIVEQLKQALAGKQSGPDLLAELEKLRAGLVTNDANAQSELDKKFPT